MAATRELILLNTDAEAISLSNPAQIAKLEAAIYAKVDKARMATPSLIVVDTFAQAAGVSSENDNAEVGASMAHLQRLAANTGATVLVIHHSPKASPGDLRGASAMRGAVRTVLFLDEEGRLRQTKNNLGPALTYSTAVRIESVPGIRPAAIGTDGSVGVLVEDNERPTSLDDELMGILARFALAGRTEVKLSDVRTDLEENGRKGSGAYQATKRLVAAGLITQRKVGKNSLIRLASSDELDPDELI
jgi:hypothetical protein